MSASDSHCDHCGAAHASHGIGPPLRKEPVRLCAEDFKRQPEGQAMFNRRIGELADDA